MMPAKIFWMWAGIFSVSSIMLISSLLWVWNSSMRDMTKKLLAAVISIFYTIFSGGAVLYITARYMAPVVLLLFLSGCGDMIPLEVNVPPPPVQGNECPEGTFLWQVPPDTLPDGYPITFICVPR